MNKSDAYGFSMGAIVLSSLFLSLSLSFFLLLICVTGVPTQTLHCNKGKVLVGPNQTTVYTLDLKAQDYLNKVSH